MKRLSFLFILFLLLIACDDKVPQGCKAAFKPADIANQELEIKGYMTDSRREQYKLEREYMKAFPNTLLIHHKIQREEICKEFFKLYQYRLEQIYKAKSKSDFEYIFYKDTQRIKMLKENIDEYPKFEKMLGKAAD